METMDTKQFEGLWATRPIRPSTNRTVAGVCAGIGARYRVDPTLVKIAFVVATLFGGSGLVLYIAAWVATPSENKQHDELGSIRHGEFIHGPTQQHSRHRRHRNPQLILLIVLAIIVLTSFGPNTTWSSGGLLGAALMLLGWWLLYQRTPEPPAGTSVDTHHPVTPDVVAARTDGPLQPWIPRAMMTGPSGAAPATPTNSPGSAAPPAGPSTSPPGQSAFGPGAFTAGAPDVASQRASGTGPAAPTDTGPAEVFATDELRRTPPAWDPLGTARFAWDLPEPATEQAIDHRSQRRSPLTLVVIGLAVIVAAAGAALHQVGVDWFTPARIVSMALAVVGGGLIYAGLRRRNAGGHSAGLVPIALILGVAVIATTSIGHLNLPSGGVGERTWTPIAESDIDDAYSLTMGKMVLDLRGVDITADRTVELRNGVGEIEVLVGENTNISANCDANVGDYVCPDGLDGGRDGTDGPVLTIDAHTNVGHVEVTR
ncbi:PspC domain-containing protein [Gordonia sp. GW1C4-4]|jgi:phage shock protein PspC (stress-responsive transcriptional regulator)|uniref:PspC domain-containing protein n=2 Tax=Gordonia tangerina TaxID=2911060 RepID=A0ABS9DIF7_9ACTN|nr:PspC domain-containing protein [Gordonia tangerina]